MYVGLGVFNLEGLGFGVGCFLGLISFEGLFDIWMVFAWYLDDACMIFA